MKFTPVALLFIATALAADALSADDKSSAVAASGSSKAEASAKSDVKSDAKSDAKSDDKSATKSADKSGDASKTEEKKSGITDSADFSATTEQVVTAEGETITVDPTDTKVDINRFSALYDGPYSSDMVLYASYLAGVGFPATKISAMLTAYRYGSSQTQDQSSYDTYLSQWVVNQSEDVSIRATKSYSFAKETTEVLEFDNELEASEYLRTASEGGDDKKKSDDKSSGDDKKTTDKKNNDSKSESGSSDSKSESGSSGDNKSSDSLKGDAVSFAAPIGAALGAIAVALL